MDMITNSFLDEVKSGNHGGWDTFGLEGEGVFFHQLEKIFLENDFNENLALIEIDNLTSSAKSYAYACADSALNLGDDDLSVIIRENTIDNLLDGDNYRYELEKSYKSLSQAANTSEKKTMLENLKTAIETSIEEGVKQRLSMEEISKPTFKM